MLKLNSGLGDQEIAEDLGEGYLDKDGNFVSTTPNEKEFHMNERLFQRLTKVANQI